MERFKDKIVLVTGGTSGIGLAAAKLLLEEGARVIVTGRNPDNIAQAKITLGSLVDVITADVSDLAATRALFQTLRTRYGRVDALFINAGFSQFAPFAETPPELFDLHFNTNVRGAYFTVQEALPLMPEGSAILINASVVASMGTPMASVYSASKAALRSLGRTLAAEFVPRLRVNVISPGLIDTPVYGKMGMPPEAAQALTQKMTSMIPMKRFGTAEEVARAALFLLSADSAYITGTEVFVDGGVTGIGAASGMIGSVA